MTPRVNILGVGVHALTRAGAVRQIADWIARGERHYVNVCTVHTVMECQSAPRLRDIVNRSGLAVTDGMPLVWLARWHGHGHAERVYGPNLMLDLCEYGLAHGYRHYFYGGAPGVADAMATRLRARYPGLDVPGVWAPPLRLPDTHEDDTVIASINAARPDVVWVGLGAPKQDYWVARHRDRLNAAVLIGVGAAFDFHAGLLKQAPSWMQRSGLEWLFRLWQEPRRLAYRYLVYNPVFVWRVALQSLGVRRYRFDG